LQNDATAEAYELRRLWQSAAAFIVYNEGRMKKPRGEDEARMIDKAKLTDKGVMWSGETSGWIK